MRLLQPEVSGKLPHPNDDSGNVVEVRACKPSVLFLVVGQVSAPEIERKHGYFGAENKELFDRKSDIIESESLFASGAGREKKTNCLCSFQVTIVT
jgi:hypothetical protein